MFLTTATTLLGGGFGGGSLGHRVLLIEDDDDVRAQLTEALAAEQYRVDALPSAQEAVRHLEHAPPPDAIVLDLLMPLMSGWELLAWLAKRAVLSSVPVLVISGSPHAEQAQALHPTIVGWLTKPFGVDALLTELSRILERSGD